jgi:cytochrome c oxidase assembly protein subunit 15
LSAVILQAALGIQTLLHQAPLPLALMHQAMAMIVLTLATLHAQRLSQTVSPASGQVRSGFSSEAATPQAS